MDTQLCTCGTGNLTITSSRIFTGPYSTAAIGLSNTSAVTLTINGSTRVYASNSDSTGAYPNYCIFDGNTSSKNKYVINTTGYLYAGGKWVLNWSSTGVTATITKGNFATQTNRYMFGRHDPDAIADYPLTAHRAGTTKSSLTFRYMNAYNSETTKTVSCYSYSYGI